MSHNYKHVLFISVGEKKATFTPSLLFFSAFLSFAQIWSQFGGRRRWKQFAVEARILSALASIRISLSGGKEQHAKFLPCWKTETNWGWFWKHFKPMKTKVCENYHWTLSLCEPLSFARGFWKAHTNIWKYA